MNKKKVEIQKIKVKNGSELITKAKEYKNSGGEWNLREFYLEMPKGKNSKKRLNWGILISDGKKEINICSLGEKRVSKSGIYDEIEVRDQLHQLFPQAAYWLFAGKEKEYDEYGGRPTQSRLDHGTCKLVKEVDSECWLYRYLVAEKFHDLEKIIENYFRENEAKIYNSPNRKFSDWVEIIDGQDGNMYLYVGEKNESGGREIKIGIKKEDFDKKEVERLKDRGKYFSGKEMLETDWNLYIMSSNQPQTPTERENYYRSLEETFQEQWPHREKLCRKYWEGMAERAKEGFNYWHEKSRQIQYWDHEANEQGNLLNAYANTIKEELSKNQNIKICSDECRHLHDPSLPKTNDKNNQLKDSEKSQLLQYFLTHNISKITLDNGKLVIEYNDYRTEIKEINSQELEKYQKFIENQPKHSISLSDLQTTSLQTTPNDNKLAIGLALGAGVVILVGGIVFFLSRKKKVK